MALQDVESQTVAVIAPAIEWEGMNHRGNKGYNFSKCKDYRIVNRNGKFVAYKWGKEDALYDGNSEPEAIAACQAHKQAQVDKAIEGCNVRDFMPLLEKIKQEQADAEKYYDENSDDLHKRLAASSVFRTKVTRFIREWEEAQP